MDKADILKLRRDLQALRSRLEELRDAIHDYSKSISAVEESRRANGPPTVNAVVAYESETSQNARNEFRKQLRVQKYLTIGTWLAFGAAVIYATIAARQLRATNNTYQQIQKQTDLMRQQLIGNQAAVITTTIPPFSSDTNLSERELIFQLDNTGALVGTLISFEAEVQRRSLPKGTPIGEPTIVRAQNKKIQKGRPFQAHAYLGWSLPELKSGEAWPGNEFVTVEGSYTYENGFDERFTQRLCYVWVPHWLLPKPYNWGGGGWDNENGGQPCRTVQDFANERLARLEYLRKASGQGRR